jgi:hypothetical protein
VAHEDDRSRDLHRKRMADGGEVISGSLAADALRAVGARAMTMDRTIFVDEDFNPDDAEDQALYAHELHHQQNSGAEREHGGGHDAEEHAARSIERMVLHRRAAGEDFGSVMRDVRQGRVSEPAAGGAKKAGSEAGKDADDPMRAYHAMRRKGMSHDDIVEMLARHVVDALTAAGEDQQMRAPGSARLT